LNGTIQEIDCQSQFFFNNAASVTVFLHLKNDSYSIFDGTLMNPHVSPYTAHTNSALQATVDLLNCKQFFDNLLRPLW